MSKNRCKSKKTALTISKQEVYTTQIFRTCCNCQGCNPTGNSQIPVCNSSLKYS